MSTDRIDEQRIKETTNFHGHWCPGLAIGIRAAEWALKEMGKAPDEEIVAVVETDMCGVDAIQYLTGCTFGKGNLIHKDYGKKAFTFYRRRDGKAVRLVLRPTIYGDTGPLMRKLHHKMQTEGLSQEEEPLFLNGSWILKWPRFLSSRRRKPPCRKRPAFWPA
jgi:formylmethanofuran dehydrogenase subunit E